ncbi:MAG: class II glutamine amidotransferase, partial [Bdellovibrionales bacterium]|nr:class II glutamine amidotransferase [Bdellovibrionales bacterium]
MSKLLQEPENSLINQSHHSRERDEPLNGDGFGVGWYNRDVHREPAALRSVRPAWNDRNLGGIAPKVRSDCIVAHIRAATRGEVTEQNCHPFQFNELIMMHNGTVKGFTRMKRILRQQLSDDLYDWVRGSTDSEHFFALFLENLQAHKEEVTLAKAAKALPKTIAQIEEMKTQVGVDDPVTLNLAFTNGDWLLSCKYATPSTGTPNTLYFSQGTRYECEDGVCRMVQSDPSERAVLVVS